ncbi:hypothetical protein [Sphaerothrix gracilis]|uniref:hypothetical protein n=1 Tax=Sphaerothrix gracilis TaxID=3151835 RepID=UPI0031FCE18E
MKLNPYDSKELTDVQWSIADAIARRLVIEGTDVNELWKVISYLRDSQHESESSRRLFDYLKVLASHGYSIGHSKRTLVYFQSLYSVCSQYLDAYQDDLHKTLQILGWAARLILYYSKGVPTGEIIERPDDMLIISEREAEIQAITRASQFAVGQELEAIVTGIKGKKVTYEILGSIRLTQKEPKLASKLSEGQLLKVRIEDLRDNGTLKRVKGLTF